MNVPLNSRDWEFLSTYLDGQMSQAEQQRAEAHLARRPELGQALDELRRTRDVLRAAPRHRAPRNFTLTPAMARQAGRRSVFSLGWVPSLSFTSALAVVLLVLSFFVRLPAGGLPAAPMAAQAPKMLQAEGAPQEKAILAETTASPAISLNETARDASATAQPMASVPLRPDADLPKAASTTNMSPLDAAFTPEPAGVAGLAAGVVDAVPTANAPILSVTPTEEGTPTLSATPPMPSMSPPPEAAPAAAPDNWLWVQMGLGLAALLSGLAAIALWRRARH